MASIRSTLSSRALLALVGSWLCSSHGHARAEAVDNAFVKDALLITGRDGAAETILAIAEDEELTAPIALTLDWQASELVSLEASTISVRVDDSPMRSAKLAQLSSSEHRGSVLVKLGTLSAGFHRVSVEAHLVVPGEPCRAEHERETWLRVLDSSRVRYARRVTPARDVSIATLAERWSAAPSKQISLLDARGARIDSATRALAILEADHMLRRLGVQPVRSDAAKGSGAFRLAVLDDPGLEQAPWPELSAVLVESPAAQTSVKLDGEQLYMLARSDAALLDGVRTFAKPEVRALCDATDCALGAIVAGASAANTASAHDALTVLRLGDAGFPHGFIARGLGDHVLRFGWERPASATVRGWPTLHLELRAPDDAGLVHTGSRVVVELNETPIASYDLEHVGSNVSRLEVRIPEEHWTDPYWSFQVHTRLAAPSNVPCAQVDGDGFWLVIGAASSLDVPRDAETPTGIARLFAATKSGLPPIIWPGSLDASGLQALAAVTFPLREQRPDQMLRIAKDASDCKPFCVSAIPAAQAKLGGLKLHAGVPGAWENTGGRAPLLSAADTIYLVRAFNAGHDELVVIPASQLVSTLEPPQLFGLQGDQAVFHTTRWSALPGSTDVPQQVEIRARVNAPAAPPSRTPEEQKHLRALDLVWAATLIITLVGLSLLISRRAKHLRSTS